MANLAHRASQFMDKKFLIIHPTADGRSGIIIIFITKYVKKQNKKNNNLSHLVPLEKVHFQHTAKFIAQLISEKANYTLQVCSLSFLCSVQPLGAL